MKKRYRRMIAALREKEGGEKEWSVYLLCCADGTLYTGIAKDVEDRISRHNSGKGAAYTRARRPVRLLYRHEGLTRSEALVCEARVKALPRAMKERFMRDLGATS